MERCLYTYNEQVGLGLHGFIHGPLLTNYGYRATAPGYQRNKANPSYQERRQSMEDTLSKFMSESAKRHEENSNLIKEIGASTDAAIRNQGASIKTLEIQIGPGKSITIGTEFPAIVFDDAFTSEVTHSCEPTVSPLNDNKIDFRISFDEFDDEDYTDFENEFPAIVYNDALTSKSDFSTKPTVSP
ncbi:hypothetical protein Tco_1244920 [Tanacetum coccineum]